MLQPDAQMSQNRLSRALYFNSDDLNANRSGRLSCSQRTIFRWSYRGRAAAGGAIAMIPLIALFALPSEARSLSGVLILVAALCLGLACWQLYLLRRILLQGHVRCVEGELSYPQSDMMPYGERLSPPVVIGIQDEEFPVALAIQNAFVQGATYRLYYLPFPRHVLSAELIALANN